MRVDIKLYMSENRNPIYRGKRCCEVKKTRHPVGKAYEQLMRHVYREALTEIDKGCMVCEILVNKVLQ